MICPCMWANLGVLRQCFLECYQDERGTVKWKAFLESISGALVAKETDAEKEKMQQLLSGLDAMDLK